MNPLRRTVSSWVVPSRLSASRPLGHSYIPRLRTFASSTPTPDDRLTNLSTSPTQSPDVNNSPSLQARSSLVDNMERTQSQSRRARKQPALKASDTLGAPSLAWQSALQGTPSFKNAERAKAPSLDSRWESVRPVSYSLPVTTTSARSFAVKDSNVARAYRLLHRVLMENNIRRELKQQDRFESGSDRRVRLDSERHRRRFKVAVGKAVSLAMRNK